MTFPKSAWVETVLSRAARADQAFGLEQKIPSFLFVDAVLMISILPDRELDVLRSITISDEIIPDERANGYNLHYRAWSFRNSNPALLHGNTPVHGTESGDGKALLKLSTV
jgi:hypothetical protein